jgi:adenylosuccinate synthase
MCNEAGIGYEVTGLVRAYTVRHGPGPMQTFDDSLTRNIKDLHNRFGEWQREFRVGYFDAVMTRLAVDICCEDSGGRGVDNVFITCTDRLSEFENVKVCGEYSLSEKSFVVTPESLTRYGKEAKRKQSEVISGVSPVYQEYSSHYEKSSLEYQLGYAKYVHALIDRDSRLMGISCVV